MKPVRKDADLDFKPFRYHQDVIATPESELQPYATQFVPINLGRCMYVSIMQS